MSQVALPFPKKTALRAKGNSTTVVEQRRRELDAWLRTIFTLHGKEDIVRGFLNQDLLGEEVLLAARLSAALAPFAPPPLSMCTRTS